MGGLHGAGEGREGKGREGACDAAGAPNDIKETVAGAVMGEDAKLDTLHNMDKYDRVIAQGNRILTRQAG